MIVVAADTSGLLAALDEGHPDGEAARTVMSTAGMLVICPVLFSELDHMITRDFGRDASLEVLDDLRARVDEGRAVIPIVTSHTLDLAQDVRRRYRGLDLDIADAFNVVIAAEYETDAILTLDRRDFRAIEPLAQFQAFRLLPDDL
ncbi:PIN domain-containing protein [Glycomyces sp. A-F 0318]|uniref:PIN domain-containing protein n=1 Tax=Glycomyces amatae TaxID=2881355 RepID=UPI001E2C4C1D|nr:PIN domain-containing protein [Glycomyces amatae]